MLTASSSKAVGEPVGSGTTRRRPNDDDLEAGIITDGQNDIAKNEHGDRITIGVSGRKRFQKIWARKSKAGRKTTQQYQVQNDAPPANQTLSILPTQEEIDSRAETIEYLVVGLVLADNPLKYSTKATGQSRDKVRESQRAARGVLPPYNNVLRALVPTTDNISSGSIKYYVSCHELHGLCNIRTIPGEAIFYFQEIWDDVADGLTVKDRRSQLGLACKKHAARDKRPPQRALIPISANNSTPSNLISITPIVNAANILMIQYSLYSMSKQPSALAALQTTLENILPDLRSKPDNEGILSFYTFDEDLEQEEAEKAVNAIKVMYPGMIELDPKLVVELHAALRRTNLGGELPYQSLKLFLLWGHDRAVAGWKPKQLDEVVKGIIHDIRIRNQDDEISATRTVSESADTVSDLRSFISGLKAALQEIVDYFKAQAKAMREQHGGVTTHASMDELMTKIGNCVDKTALKVLEEQVMAIHAEQLATGNSNGVGYIEICIAHIDQALANTAIPA
ncbi:Uncharacterized protein BP5553_04249 [Venustampulla echinocandica]|uniref:Uncharacterized protein n=1 Tax=Venustampulla echinocandica TaxID=2656787 RepID=A0A370TWL3_9HELO|nr:Uncharacterized protein BP5553_04249 [Venustampulla echinocandica]RDL39909.1 Uncharacterized protein BP5553_04249 [Venustampulla echinocandica]